MKSIFTVLFLLLLSVYITSCASSEPGSDNAHPYSDIADGFMTQEPRTYREGNHRPNEFFFKHCEQEFSRSHYSKTAYFCNER